MFTLTDKRYVALYKLEKPIMTIIQLYQLAYNFLLKQEQINEPDLKKHLTPEVTKPDNLKVIFRRLCESSQNRQMLKNVISKSINGINDLGKVLYNFDPHLVANNYQKTDSAKLLSIIVKEVNPRGKIRTGREGTIWPQYCQSVIDSAHFLKTFNSANNFYKWADFFASDSKAKPALPTMISIEITGMGFALACDFLKEIGYTEFGKPDRYTIWIFKKLNLLDPTITSTLKTYYYTLRVFDSIAEENNVTAYAVDKLFWLIGSGDFYLSGIKIGRQKEKFITEIKKHYPQYQFGEIDEK